MSENAYLPYKPILKSLARQNRTAPTPAERAVWYQLLSKRQLAGHKFLRQKPIHGYIADFYCAKLQLVVEIDGICHLAQAGYDDERTRIFEAHGLTVLRFSNELVLNEIEVVRQRLLAFTLSKRQE
jgi:adenine-specific DNA-methyltransferase